MPLIRGIYRSLLLAFSLWLAVGPLALLQVGAWAWMLASYSQEGSVEQAIRDTFSDERPCEMCKLIDAVEQKEQKVPASAPDKNDYKNLTLMLGLGGELNIHPPDMQVSCAVFEVWTYEELSYAAPSPPPRNVA